jgi:hypothetical protein
MKNHYTLNPGEFFVAEEITRQRRDIVVHFPLVDRGYDLLVTKQNGGQPVRIQIKESRVYHHSPESPGRASTWHQLRDCKLTDADVFIFVWYPVRFQDNKTSFATDYLVIPQKELRRLCANKKSSKGMYSFYFRNGENGLVESREGKDVPVQAYHRAWHLI